MRGLPYSIGNLKSLRTLIVDGNDFEATFQMLLDPLIKSYQNEEQSNVLNPGQGYLYRLQGYLQDLGDIIKGREEDKKINICNRVPLESSGMSLLQFDSIQVEFAQSFESEKRKNVILEILSTEETYVNELNSIYSLYMSPLMNSNSFSKDHYNMLFLNLDDIRLLHKRIILPALKEIVEASPAKSIGSLFHSLSPLLLKYVYYLNNFGFSSSLANTISQSSSTMTGILKIFSIPDQSLLKFINVEQEAKLQDDHSQINIAAFLMLPIQRIPRYKLLLDSLLSNTHESHPDYPYLIQATESINRLLEYLNNEKRSSESRLQDLEPIFNLKFNKTITTTPLLKLLLSQREIYGQFNSLVVVKFVEWNDAAQNDVEFSPLLLCGKKSQIQTLQIENLVEYKLKISKDATPTSISRTLETEGSLSKFNVPLVQGKKCKIILCTKTMIVSTYQSDELAGCIHIPSTRSLSLIPSRSTMGTPEAVLRMSTGKCCLYLKGSIIEINRLCNAL